MSNINFNLNSGNDEYNSLKEAIFKRAREKAEALNTELKTSYTSDVKNDIMESARVSVRNNPFLNLQEEDISVKEADVDQTVSKHIQKDIRHSRDWAPNSHRRISSRINNQLYAAAVREGAMREASATIRQNQNLMNSLSFLNTQAAIALTKKSAKKIDVESRELKFGI